MSMDLIEEIISASKKDPVIIKSALNSEKPKKKVHFQKGIPSNEDSRRSKGLEASRISSLQGRTKAQQVVLHLIENTVTAEELQEMCRYIIPGQYEDVCQERCISGVCGYPLCRVPYKDNYGNKEVIFRCNKVYDINRRRNYCSDVCFEASALVSEQISFTPHYLREHESWEELFVNVPDSSSLRGRRGDLRDIGGDTDFADSMRKMRREQLKKKSGPQPSERTVEEAALAGLLANEGGTLATTEEEPEQQLDERPTEDLPVHNNTTQSRANVIKSDASQHDKENRNTQKLMIQNKKSKKKRKPKINPELVANMNNNIDNVSSLLERLDTQTISSPEGDRRLSNNNLNKPPECSDDGSTKKALPQTENIKEGSKATNTEGLVRQVEEHLLEWLTWDSYVMVLGETFLQGLLESNGLMSEHREEQQPAFESALDSDVCRLRYWRLCSRLARQERLEEIEASSVAAEAKTRPSSDAPDMETLRQDVQKMALKVKCFLSGREESALEDLPPDDGADEQRDEINPLPLVDRYEQRAWRRKVFFESVHKTERTVVAGLGLSGEDLRPLLSHLVTTFNLTAHNLYLRTPQWTLVLLVLLRLLAVRYPAVSAALTDVTLLQREVWPRLTTLALPPNYLDTLVPTLLDSTTIINKFMEGAGVGATMSGAAILNPVKYESNTSHKIYSELEALD